MHYGDSDRHTYCQVMEAVYKGKGKAFPLQAFDRPLGSQEVEAPRISRQSAQEGGKVVSPTHRLSLPPGRISSTHFC